MDISGIGGGTRIGGGVGTEKVYMCQTVYVLLEFMDG